MKNLSIFFLIALFSIDIHASELRYSFNGISDDLKVGADAIVRTEQMLYTVQDIDKATLKYKVAITLLNGNADFFRYADIHYNNFNKVNYVRASVFDEKGNLVKVIRSSEIFDMSAVTGGTLHSDARKKVIRFPLMKYPYTIEYEYESSISSLTNFPTWFFQDYSNVSVEESGIQYVVPKNLMVKFKEARIPARVDSVDLNNKMVYTWQIENMPTVKTNSYGIPYEMGTPILYASPVDFSFDGYKGSTSSWKSFGEWNKSIIEGRDNLSDSEIQKVKELVKGIPSDRDKIKRVYEYMQSRTRYVAIALGIGGLQPMLASEVEAKGYGDCKALTNYTMALLKAIGIKSYYTLVSAGKDYDIDPDFVSNQFDHVILCVPQPNDTIWLECTSQTLPFNYLSDFTSDRYVLLTKDDGGEMVRTPSFKKEENLYKKTGVVKINSSNYLTQANINEFFSGVNYGDIHLRFSQQDEEEIKRLLNNELSYSTFEVLEAEFIDNKSEKPTAELKYNLDIRDFSTKTASRILFSPVLRNWGYLLNDPFEVWLSESEIFIDSIEYIIPNGYQVEYLPQNKVFDEEFGTYSYSIENKDNSIVFNRKVVLNKGKYSKKEFDKFHRFINSIATSDRERIILKKKKG